MDGSEVFVEVRTVEDEVEDVVGIAKVTLPPFEREGRIGGERSEETEESVGCRGESANERRRGKVGEVVVVEEEEKESNEEVEDEAAATASFDVSHALSASPTVPPLSSSSSLSSFSITTTPTSFLP